MGCHTYAAFNYVKKHGIDFENKYPYIAQGQNCKYKNTTISGNGIAAKNAPQWYTFAADERSLAYAIHKYGWVTLAINAKELHLYQSGIVRANQCDSSKVDHAVIAVGFGTQKGIPYWLVRNSWGSSWGDAGYFMLERGTNTCGIMTASKKQRLYVD